MTKSYIRLFVWSLLLMLGVTQSAFADVVTAQWNWQTSTPASIAEMTTIEGTTGTVASDQEGIELYVDATNGKLALNGTNVQFNAGTILHVPVVSTNDVVTVTGFPNNSNYSFDGGETVQNTQTYTANSYDVNRGYVVVTATSGSYLYAVSVAQDQTAAATAFKNFAVDLTNGNLLESSEQTQWSNVGPFGIAVDAEGGLTRVDDDASNAACVVSGKWHSNNYGWANLVVSVPVDGPVKITLGTNNASTSATVKNGEETVSTINISGSNWSSTATSNVATGEYTGSATTLTINAGSYQNYFAIEALDPTTLVAKSTVTFDAGESTGTAPSAITEKVGSTIVMPKNYTMYIEGKTLTGWSDGTNTYAVGAEYTVPESDVTLTAVFEDNTVNLADRTEAVTLKWQFGQANNDKTVLNYQGSNGKGYYVTQATVGENTIDVKMDIDATNGKLSNSGRSDKWAQANGGTKVTVPSCKGAVVTVNNYSTPDGTTIDGQAATISGTTATATIASDNDSVDVVAGNVSNSYWSDLTVVLPYVEPSAAGTVFDNVSGSITWAVGNEVAPAISDDIKVGISNAAVSIGDKLTTKTATYKANPNAMLQCQPTTSNAGTDTSHMLEYLVKAAKGVTMTIGDITYDAVKVGTNSATYSYSTVIDGVESSVVTVEANDILRNSNDNASTAQLGHTISVNSEASTFALRIYISGFNNAKQCAIGNVVINATLNGTVADVAKYTFSATSNIEEAGTVTVYPSSDTYEEGSEVTLTATENFGYDFVNWTDAQGEEVSTDAKFVYTVNAETALTANFKQVNTYELDLTIEGGAADYMITWSPEPTVVDGKKMYEEGTQVTLTASNNTILTFNSWSDNSTFSENKLTMNEDKTLTATYSAIDFIAAWDFVTAGANGRAADFASEDNTTAALVLIDADGNTQGWLDKSKAGDKNGYEGRYCAVNWKSLDAKYYYQTKVNAKNFSNIQVQSEMLYNYNAYETQKLEYSLDGENWNTLTTVTLAQRTWSAVNATLPAEADHAETLYLRWIPDYTSEIKGSSGNDGTAIANIFILADADIYNDGVAPVLVSSVPADQATSASATGKIVLNFDEKVKLTDGATATLGGNDIELTVSGKTVSAAYKNLEYGTEYVFVLTGGSVADLADNTMTDAVTINFTTMERPTVTKDLYDFIVPDDGTFEEAIAAAAARSDNTQRFYIFLKKGEYFLEGSGEELSIDRKDSSGNILKTDHAKSPITTISTPNVSIIGESMDETILWNLPESDEANNRNGEGIGTTATIYLSNAAVNTYFQDITLKNAYPYASTTGRAVCLQDKSDKTIAKNVKLLSHQDTYYSNNSSARFYWEDSELHGDVDFLCGGGDVYYNRCNLVIEKRNGNVIAAPNGQKKYGYVFLDCEINPVDDDAYSTVNGTFNLGRPWGADCRAQYINTKMNILPTAYGWAEMSGHKPSVFAEYNSTDKNGNTVDLSSRKLTFDGGTQTSAVLTEAQVEELSVANVMGGDDSWDPTLATEQAPLVQNVVLENNTLTWDGSDYAMLYAIVRNGNVVAFTTDNSYDTSEEVTAKAAGQVANATDVWAVRAANEMGGLNEAVEATNADAVTEVKADEKANVYDGRIYNLAGQQVSDSYKGVVIVNGVKVIK